MATLKYSRQRESIKEFLTGRTDHPTADFVYENMKQIYPNISLGTVYRNLSLLADLGEIQKLWRSRPIRCPHRSPLSLYVHPLRQSDGRIQRTY